jgi:hypothetical protein
LNYAALVTPFAIMPLPPLGLVLVGLAVIFHAAAFHNYLKAEGKLTPPRKTWLRIAIIFSVVAIVLYFATTVFR